MTEKKKPDGRLPVSLVVGCVIVFALILIIGVAAMLGGEAEMPTIAPTSGTVHTTGAAPSGETEELHTVEQTREQTGTEPVQETVTDPAAETKPPQKPTEPDVQIPETLPQQEEASYERWLSAGMVVGLSMNYPDFQLQGIYITGETALEDRMSSGGACILFTSGGEALALRSTPLEAERKTPGTIDLSSQTIGFATFDVTDASAVDTAGMTAVDVAELSELIAQSMLVSLYWN